MLVGRTLCAAWIAVLALFVFSGNAAAQDGRWVRAESRHFIAYSDHSEARTRQALEELEGFDELLRVLTRRAPETEEPVKLEVYLFRSAASLREVWPSRGSSVLGFYTARPEIVAAFAIFRDRGLEAEEVLFHEYAHHFLLQNFTVAYPKWFVEGFAEYVQTAEIAPERVTWGRYSQARAYSLGPQGWPPMERMLRGDHREGEVNQFYALSWLMTHYFYHQPERQVGLKAYFDSLRDGGDPVAEFPNAIGMSLEEFERELRAYLRGRINYHIMTQAPRSASAVSISHLPEAADDLLTLMARIRLGGVAETERSNLLGRVRRGAERYGNDGYAQRALALAEITLGSPAAARARLEPLLGRNGEDAEALYLTGLSYLMEGRANEDGRTELYRQGRRFFSRAFRRNPNHVPTLYRYVETHSAEPAPLTVQQLDVLVHARNLAPQVAEIGLNTGGQLIAARRFEEAAAVLRQIAYNPHGGDASKRALEMLAEAERLGGGSPQGSQPAAN
jgi:hypothetical protein